MPIEPPASGVLINAEMRISQVPELLLPLCAAEGHVGATTVAQYGRVIDNIINPAIGNTYSAAKATAGRIERLIVGQPPQGCRKKVKTVLGRMLERP